MQFGILGYVYGGFVIIQGPCGVTPPGGSAGPEYARLGISRIQQHLYSYETQLLMKMYLKKNMTYKYGQVCCGIASSSDTMGISICMRLQKNGPTNNTNYALSITATVIYNGLVYKVNHGRSRTLTCILTTMYQSSLLAKRLPSPSAI